MSSYANPQSLNRYSYVLNDPIRYADPSGHRVTACTSQLDPACGAVNGGSIGNTTTSGGSGGNGHHGSGGHGGADPGGDVVGPPSPNVPSQSLPTGNEEIDKYLDKIFDPYCGSSNPCSDTEIYYQQVVSDLYDSMGIPIEAIAANRESNPLTFDQINDATDYIGSTSLLTRAGHVPYGIFLGQLGIPGDHGLHITNYEPRYLAALMKAFPLALIKAKEQYIRQYPNALEELKQNLGPGPEGGGD